MNWKERLLVGCGAVEWAVGHIYLYCFIQLATFSNTRSFYRGVVGVHGRIILGGGGRGGAAGGGDREGEMEEREVGSGEVLRGERELHKQGPFIKRGPRGGSRKFCKGGGGHKLEITAPLNLEQTTLGGKHHTFR